MAEVRRCETVADVFKLVDAAIEDRDSGKLIAMVEAHHAIAKYTNIEGKTILFEVTKAGLSKRVIYTLLKHGADPSIVGHAQRIPPVWNACYHGYDDNVILTLLANGNRLAMNKSFSNFKTNSVSNLLGFMNSAT
jgi:hypothetical protein